MSDFAANPITVENAVCLGCGCVCDDIRLNVKHNVIVAAERACPLGLAWFAQRSPVDLPPASLNGRPAAVEEAAAAAARILAAARQPVICGLSALTCEAQCEAVALAERIGASLAGAESACHATAQLAFQTVGASAATLGEIRNRADLVVYWGADPRVTHPRHFSRFVARPEGRPGEPRGKRPAVVLVNDAPNASLGEADVFIQIKPGRDFEALWALRALVKGRPIGPEIEEGCGVPPGRLRWLAERMRGCRYGAIVFGQGLAARGERLSAEALQALVIDLNEHAHFVAQSLCATANEAGADNVLAWQTGYPGAVNFSRGYPRYGPGEFGAAELLSRGEADAALLVSGRPASQLAPAAVERLKHIPVIALDLPVNVAGLRPRVAFTTAPAGIEAGGTVYRLDGVPLTLRPFLPSAYPTGEQVLQAIRRRVGGAVDPAGSRS